jgi:hypothetical protein
LLIWMSSIVSGFFTSRSTAAFMSSSSVPRDHARTGEERRPHVEDCSRDGRGQRTDIGPRADVPQ